MGNRRSTERSMFFEELIFYDKSAIESENCNINLYIMKKIFFIGMEIANCSTTIIIKFYSKPQKCILK